MRWGKIGFGGEGEGEGEGWEMGGGCVYTRR